MGNKHLENKKIICTVTNDLFRDRRMIRICSALQESGAETLLIGIEKPESPALIQQSFKQLRFKMLFKKGVLFYLEYNIRLFFYLMFHDFDIVNTVDTDTVIPGFIISRIKRKKIVFDAHEYFTGVPELQNRRLKKNIWDLMEKIVLTKIKDNYTVSQSLKKLYESKTGQKYEVVRNFPLKSKYAGIEIPDKGLSKDIVIAYVGALNKGRGLESALEMLTYLGKRYKLLLIGGGDLEDELKTLAVQLKLSERVQFTGWVNPDRIPQLLNKSHIGLNLLDEDSLSYRRSLANKVFDYIHLGIPCLTMDFDEYKIINNKYNCFIFTGTLDPETNCKLIELLISDEGKYNNLKQKSLEASCDMVWEKEKEKLEKIYF
jgi:glycosyltransferase involved in cell wall biosynthesis